MAILVSVGCNQAQAGRVGLVHTVLRRWQRDSISRSARRGSVTPSRPGVAFANRYLRDLTKGRLSFRQSELVEDALLI